MPVRPIRISSRAWLAGAALCALNAGAAAAKDLPATPEGAQKLNAFFATYLGAPRAGAPLPYKVTPEGSDYLVSVDLAALAAPLATAGFSSDPATFTTKLIEQDDGAWRVESGDAPPSPPIRRAARPPSPSPAIRASSWSTRRPPGFEPPRAAGTRPRSTTT